MRAGHVKKLTNMHKNCGYITTFNKTNNLLRAGSFSSCRFCRISHHFTGYFKKTVETTDLTHITFFHQ
jgi:hypothetical protein